MDKILLVDDVKLLLEIQKGILASSKVQILTANDGLEALALTRKELPQLIVMDHQMPNMDGVTCCRQLKADPLLRHIPVIMLTNTVNPADFALYREAGAIDCLSKPIDSKLFLSAIKKLLPAIERRGIRVPLCTEVRLTVNGGKHTGASKDVSTKGIFVASSFRPVAGEEIKFAFDLPGSSAATEVLGKVAWVRNIPPDRKSGFIAEFGIEFIEVTGQGIPFVRKNELAAYISRQAPPGAVDSAGG